MSRLARLRPQALLRDEAGNSLLEFAASAAILLILVVGIMQCSRALYADHFTANAAREATRYAAAHGYSFHGVACSTPASFACEASATDIARFVQAITPNGLSVAATAVTTNWPGTDATGAGCTSSVAPANAAGCTVVVRVAYSFQVVIPFFPPTTLPLSSTSTLTIAQ